MNYRNGYPIFQVVGLRKSVVPSGIHQVLEKIRVLFRYRDLVDTVIEFSEFCECCKSYDVQVGNG